MAGMNMDISVDKFKVCAAQISLLHSVFRAHFNQLKGKEKKGNRS